MDLIDTKSKKRNQRKKKTCRFKRERCDIYIPVSIVMCGESRTGKTYLLIREIKTTFLGVFDRIVLVNFTYRSKRQSAWREFVRDMVLAEKEQARLMKREPVNRIIVISSLEEFKQYHYDPQNQFKEFKAGSGFSILKVFDDIIGEVENKDLNSHILRAFTRERHDDVNVAVLTQDSMRIPKTARVNARIIYFFPTQVYRMIEQFASHWRWMSKELVVSVCVDIASVPSNGNYICVMKDCSTISVGINNKVVILCKKTMRENAPLYYANKSLSFWWLQPEEKEYLKLSK